MTIQTLKFPRPLINKLNILSTINEKYKYINQTFELLQTYPEMFLSTSINLLYILNMNLSQKQEYMYTIFKSFIESNDLETPSSVLLLSYYAYDLNFNHDKDIPLIEPIFKYLKKAQTLFEESREVYFEGKKFNINELKPIMYQRTGYNYFNYLPYVCFFYTFYINGRPYRFTDDLGTEALQENLYANFENYLATNYKNLAKQLDLPSPDFDIRFKDEFKAMFDVILNIENIKQLRNDFMNHQDILDECVQDQSDLTEEFIYNSYKSNMNKLVEIIVYNTPFKKIYDSFPTFEPVFIDKSIRQLNYQQIKTYLEYALSGGNAPFYYDESLTEHLFKPSEEYPVFTCPFVETQKLKTSISKYINSFETPFISSNIVLKTLTEYILHKFQDNQTDSIFDNYETLTQPEITDIPSIKLCLEDFNGLFQQEIINLVLPALYNLTSKELKVFVNYLFTLSFFKNEIQDIFSFEDLFKKLYHRPVINSCVGCLLLSYFKEFLVQIIQTKKSNFGKLNEDINNDDFERFMYIRFLFNNIFNEENEYTMNLTNKIYDSTIALKICQNQEFRNFVSDSVEEFEKILNDSLMYLVYISGNDDDVDIYSLGGLKLYNKMLDINPFNRSFEFMKQCIGIGSNEYIFKKCIESLKDASIIELLMSSNNTSTIDDIISEYAKKNRHEFLIYDYSISIVDESLQIKPKINNWWLSIDHTKFLKFMFNQIVGNTLPNKIFKSRLINTLDDADKVNEVVENGLEIDKNKIYPVVIKDNSDNYEIVYYQYVGEIQYQSINFVNPKGLKHYILNVDNNYTVWIFSKYFKNLFNTVRNKYKE